MEVTRVVKPSPRLTQEFKLQKRPAHTVASSQDHYYTKSGISSLS